MSGIVVVTERWEADAGGRERYAVDLVAHLAALGRRVNVRQPREISARDVRAADAVLALTPCAAATHYQLHGGLLARAFAAERESMRSGLRRALFAPALAVNRRRQRLLAEEARVLRGGAALMAFSAACARELDADPARIVVSRPGVDLRIFAPTGVGSPASRAGVRPMQLVFVAHNFVLKGLQTAILAVARLRRRGVDATLHVAGRGPVRRFAHLADLEGVADRVRFVGLLSQHALADLYRRADALVHPTFYDPFPRVAVEALACGCPVITTARCGTAEILTNRRDGIIVADPRDDGAVADAAIALANLPRDPIRHAAAELGRRFDAATHFDDATRWLAETPAAVAR